jgi:hypothetical protein
VKKTYMQPKIKSINLEPEQAILQVCQIGGAYFGFTVVTIPTSYCEGGTRTGPNPCIVSIKGVQLQPTLGGPKYTKSS